MKIIYLSLAILFYLIGTLLGFVQKTRGDQSKVSNLEAKYPILTSLNPFGQPVATLLIMCFFLYIYSIGNKSTWLLVKID
ncbi:hypothetical protein [uncultured Polaribacter sp.]|uniref:hypothetical protein n=1 Tax=uncultured Polaribacter sp. TaxID=174711 RepID=UPI002609AA11|nr:hypothetical protein [uncultured Polaribacter sp.]